MTRGEKVAYGIASTVSETHFAITVLIILLLVASGVAMATKWVRVPYTLALVIIGLIISPMHFLPVVHISPELILLIFLPALLFEAAWNLKLDHLRKNLLPILILAVIGVSLSVGVIGVILHYGIGLSWSMTLLFGAMISATDPVSVLALFKKLRLPKRLNVIVEGESLFNDGTAVVVFRIILGIVMGATSIGSVGGVISGSLRDFIVVVFGGIAVGATIGIIGSTLTSYFDDHLLEITLTTIAAYGSYLVGEGLHVSPVIAVLIAGLVIGNYGRQRGMSPTTQVAVNSFWEYAAFVVNSLVFLLIGLEIQLTTLIENAGSIAWGVGAMLVARAVAVYGLAPLVNRLTMPIPWRWQHVLVWGGLRGSLSIALVMSLPEAAPGRSDLVVLVFGTVIFSLLAQGLTISRLLSRLGLTERAPGLGEYEALQGRLLAETAALVELDSQRSRGMLTEQVYQSLRETLTRSCQRLSQQLAELNVTDHLIEQQQEYRVQRRLIDVRKARLTELLREGILSDATYHELSKELAESIATLQDQPTSPDPSGNNEHESD